MRLLSFAFVLSFLAACDSNGGSKTLLLTGDGGIVVEDASDDAVDDDVVILATCNSTDDCLSYLLDADTCVYPTTTGDCSAYGHCVALTMPADINKCSPQRTICPCSGGTQVVPPCFGDASPYPVQSNGPCPLDDGGS